MALSLDSIYKPINDFFLDHFKTDAESPVFFKFDKFGTVISDLDFVDPRNPDLGYSPALAEEKFSDIVNSVPIEDTDGQNIYFSQSNIDTTYHDLWLGPAIPLIAEGTDETTKDSIVNSFNQIKADALKIWDNIKLESSTGLMFSFKPSLATPENWYDKNAGSIWTRQVFQISETVTTPSDNTSKFQLWRLKLDDNTLKKVLQVENTREINPKEVHEKVLIFKKKAFPPIGVSPAAMPVIQRSAASSNFNSDLRVRDHRTDPIGDVQIRNRKLDRLNDVLIRDPRTDLEPTLVPAFRENLFKSIAGLELKERVNIINYIKINSPTQSVTTKSLSISFDYCLVNINRPWLLDSFINNKTWFIPNVVKGQLTSPDSTAGNITVLPIAFLAIKNLIIEANWTAEDVANSKNATDFGPFEVTFDSISNKLAHEGIQIIGWVLQKMPDLPPNGQLQ